MLYNGKSWMELVSGFWGPSGAPLQRDVLGNLTSYTAGVTYPGSVTLGYQETGTASTSTDRLLSETIGRRSPNLTQSYAYDTGWNPTTLRSTSGLTYNQANQRTSTGYQYDTRGNLTQYPADGITRSLTYDAYNHLTSYGTLLTATYRGDDLRASKSTANGTTYFVYDGTTPVLELNGAGAPTAWNTFGPLGLLSRWNITPTNSYSRFYLFDATGNVVNRQDAWQTALSSCLYDAYGKWADPNTAEGADPFGYQGQAGYYGDIETGLYLCTFRYYEPREGRWLNEDPLGYDGGVNLYGYVGGDPVGGTDPVGLYRLIVYGSDKGVPFSWTLHQFFKHLDGPGAGPMVVQLFQPSKRELLPYLIRADSFYFWGHGSPPGELMLNNDEWFGADDLKGVMQTRCRQRVPKMTDVALHSCYGMSEPFLVNRWLQISDRVSGFKGLTTHIWTWRQTSRPWEISPRSFYDYLNPRGRR